MLKVALVHRVVAVLLVPLVELTEGGIVAALVPAQKRLIVLIADHLSVTFRCGRATAELGDVPRLERTSNRLR